MLDCKELFRTLENNGVGFYTGVPDSLLQEFCAYLSENIPEQSHIPAVNEGSAVGMAIGYHLGTGKLPLVYMQNSGIGNSVNPLLSLAAPEVYAVPMLLLIGWRGKPGEKDEPQHVKQGMVTLELLKAMSVDYLILSKNQSEAEKQIETAACTAMQNNRAFAIVVEKSSFLPVKKEKKQLTGLKREKAIELILANRPPDSLVIGTTGKISREIFEYRARLNQGHGFDFLTVGGMGHASAIALGLSASSPQKKIFCLDGDGAALMHMGVMATIGNRKNPNFIHIILNNGVHDSVGGQPTVGLQTDFVKIALSCGYSSAIVVSNENELVEQMKSFVTTNSGPNLIEVQVIPGARSDLGRPTSSPVQNKQDFICNCRGKV